MSVGRDDRVEARLGQQPTAGLGEGQLTVLGFGPPEALE
jgi:hypothetical protein